MATTYHFKAIASDGKSRSGVLTAESPKVVASELRRQGLTPVYVGLEQQKKGLNVELPSFLGGRRKKDVLFFTGELSTLLNAGVPVDRALSITSELTERPAFKLVVSDIIRILKSGKTLADSLAAHPEYFSDLYINMVRAGEASGSLATVFTRLTEFETSRDDLRSYIISSLVYPALLATVGVASVIFLLTFVIPRFASVFEESRMKIPVPTLVMLQASKFVKEYIWILVVAVVGFAIAMQTYIRTKKGRLWWDTFRLKIPLLGDALRKAEVARFARAMGTLVANSVPLVQSISIAGATLNNRRIAGSLEIVSQGVKRGEGMANPMRRTGQFPALSSHLLAVGEETGRLDTMFTRMADIYEGETRAAIKRFTSLFEPLVILVMGIIVGALILSMLLAITSINDVAI
jgi:general secretion pathway protein F